mmetsp:Transcript_62965/g.203015  ORF Transcript_62965/g.203015 Transcript_62965/m.203015 type:complete len:252 (+) Transcript_62965:1109-1864(+)
MAPPLAQTAAKAPLLPQAPARAPLLLQAAAEAPPLGLAIAKAPPLAQAAAKVPLLVQATAKAHLLMLRSAPRTVLTATVHLLLSESLDCQTIRLLGQQALPQTRPMEPPEVPVLSSTRLPPAALWTAQRVPPPPPHRVARPALPHPVRSHLAPTTRQPVHPKRPPQVLLPARQTGCHQRLPHQRLPLPQWHRHHVQVCSQATPCPHCRTRPCRPRHPWAARQRRSVAVWRPLQPRTHPHRCACHLLGAQSP